MVHIMCNVPSIVVFVWLLHPFSRVMLQCATLRPSTSGLAQQPTQSRPGISRVPSPWQHTAGTPCQVQSALLSSNTSWTTEVGNVWQSSVSSLTVTLAC